MAELDDRHKLWLDHSFTHASEFKKRIGGEPGAIKTGLFLKCPSPDFEILFLTIKGETH